MPDHVPAFDELRAVVAPGEGAGVVARFPGLLAVAEGPDAAVRRLLELCRESAGPQPGRALARRLAAWLGSDDDLAAELRFGTVAATDRGLAVFLSGPVDVLVPAQGLAVAGADAATWTDRLVDTPDTPLALTLQGATAPPDLVDSVYDLWDGVVPGVAVVAVATGVVPEQPVLPVDPGRAADRRQVPADPGDEATEIVGQPARHRRNDTAARALAAARPSAPERPRGPLAPVRPLVPSRPESVDDPEPPDVMELPDVPEQPEPPEVPAEDAAPSEAGPKAEGYLCAQGHLNDPRAQYCGLCGSDMDESAGVLVVDERPPLGVLVFDDGDTHTVDTGYLLGREPEADARVQAGTLRPITLEDRSEAMSRVHAEVRIDNWDVLLTDSGSSNGTYVAEPGAGSWTLLPPPRSFRLVPGARVRLGQRTFTFETPAGQD